MNKQRILVVDDHEPLLAAIQGILEEEGYAIFTATDGEQALQMMPEVCPNLIIADIMMPRMDGYALYDAIRTKPEWVPIPFIFLTARAEKKDRLKGKRMGVEDYLTKPFDPQELVIAVQSRLGRAQDIQQASEMKFEQLKRQIVNVLSHELRTPLTYVRGYTELALEEVLPLPADSVQEFLMGIKRGADRLHCLVEDLMLLIQLDTGRAADEFNMLTCVHPDLGTVIKVTVQQYEQRAADQGVTLELIVEPNLPPVRLCEPFFADALDRLIDNGIKFSRNKGKRVTVSARTTDGWVEVAVADEGIGITTQELSHLFKRFQQIDRETMEQQGTGLGLAIAQELIHLHDGEITAESTPGVGSTFTIRLPLAGD